MITKDLNNRYFIEDKTRKQKKIISLVIKKKKNESNNKVIFQTCTIDKD